MIASEGKIIIIPILFLFIIGIIFNGIYPSIWFNWLNILIYLVLFFSVYFFRDPKRVIPQVDGFLSPSDGKVIQIINIDDADIGSAVQISIFLSIFNVHSQWVPLSSLVIKKEYNPGKFLFAFNHKASIDNEHSIVTFKAEDGNKFKIKQIAGFIARRILNYMKETHSCKRGDRLGFIRFGSRIDIIVPSSFNILIKVGDPVIGRKTIIGYF